MSFFTDLKAKIPIVVWPIALLILFLVAWQVVTSGFSLAGGGKTYTISVDENGFKPVDITINKGDTVVFKNTGKMEHWPASNIHPTHQIYPEFDPKEGILPGKQWQFRFDKAGFWRFHDHLNPVQTGSVTVNGPEEKHSIIAKKTVLPADGASLAARKLSGLNMFTVVKNHDQLGDLLATIRPKYIMEKLLSDSGGGATIDCHQQAHAIGRVAYEVYGALAFKDGTSACHSGYYHGAMEILLKEHGTTHLAKTIQDICATFSTSFGQFECLHGVGHGLMAFVDYDLPKSLETCGLLATDYDRSSCYGGAFMENVVAGQGQGALADHQTQWVNRQDPLFPCNKINQDYNIQYQCYQMQTSWMLTMHNYDFDKVKDECLKAPKNMVSVCFKSYGRDASGNSLRNPQKIIEICGKVANNNEYYDQCITGALNVIVDFWGDGLTNQASDLCKLTTQREKIFCYNILNSRLQDVFKTQPPRDAVCNTFEPKYQYVCKPI